MTTVAIGVYVSEDPGRLQETLQSLAPWSGSAELILLPDGPDAETQQLLISLRDIRQLGDAEPLGAAACLNRLARATETDVVVLLENGVLVGPEWLECLLQALAADPRHGLAGPSTNRAWNEQAMFPHARGTPADVATRGKEARDRFGTAWQTLEPLHSLAEFCYAVRREVFTAIGDADEGYGRGPCWEMDYNIRAARAGFRGVWACGAYVYRSPKSDRRAKEEARLFERSKHRYQDRFCGLRLRGDRQEGGYESHCRGEACEHFAPPSLIAPAHQAPASPTTPVHVTVVEQTPLVTCIMPTRDRPEFVRQAAHYFQRQTLSQTELLVIDDGSVDLHPHLPADSRIRYFREAGRASIGAKRNRGVELARGRYIAHWDDDDWYGPTRLESQVAPLLAGAAEITGLTAGAFFDLATWQFWRVTPALHRRLFVQDVHGGTLVYARRLWQQGVRYPALSVAEDAHFLTRAVRQGARVARLPGEDLFVYLRHGANAWRFACGRHVDPRGWAQVPEPGVLAGDRAFYLAQGGRVADLNLTSPAYASPLATCIMPTGDRHRFVPRAVEYFLRQDHHNTELLVLDDGADPVADLLPADARIRYERLSPRRVLGAKRNIACEMARGDVILHWDDDDWMARDRVTRQVAALEANPGAGVCGLADLLFYAPATRRAWRYRRTELGRPWVAGNTMCYRKSLWARTPFAPVRDGEDTRFVWNLAPADVRVLPDSSFFVAMVHAGNTSPKRTRDACWSVSDPAIIRARLGADLTFYDELAADGATV